MTLTPSNSLKKVYPRHHYYMLSYEAFARNAVAEIERMASYFGFAHRDRLDPSGYHSVSGNPSRFESKTPKIIYDNKWESEVSSGRLILSRIIASPVSAILNRNG